MKDANSLGGRWLQKELFQPKFEPCNENSGKKNLVFFKVLGMRSVGESEREMLSRAEREEEGRERNETEIRDRKREVPQSPPYRCTFNLSSPFKNPRTTLVRIHISFPLGKGISRKCSPQ